jgi:TonB family protein
MIVSYILLLAGLLAPDLPVHPDLRAFAPKQDTVHASIDTAGLRKNLRYPERFYNDRARGFVLALYAIDKKGKGVQTAIRHHGGGDDSAMFGKAVTDAMKGVRFVPARANGAAIDAAVMVVVTFYVGLADGVPFPAYEIRVNPLSASEAKEMSRGEPAQPSGSVVSQEGKHDPNAEPTSKGSDAPPKESYIADVPPTFDQAEARARLVYPEAAKRAGIEGKVMVRVFIGKDGTVKLTGIAESPDPDLSAAAIKVIKDTKFTPALKNGSPIAYWIMIPIEFSLKGR